VCFCLHYCCTFRIDQLSSPGPAVRVAHGVVRDGCGSNEDGSNCKARPKVVAEVILDDGGVVALLVGKTATKERMA
jgi:hypothetical protein